MDKNTFSGTENEVKSLEDKYSLELYQKRDIVIVKAKNAKIWDITGKEYIDMASGIGVVNVGHANEEIISAISQQAARVMTCPGIFYNDVRARFIEKLVTLAPSDLTKVFLCNSGTETIEAAIKFARATTGKTDFICFNRAFHGRTLGALSATFNKTYKEKFEPLVQQFTHVPLNNIEKVKETVTENTAGILLEIVQGEGGLNVAESDFVLSLRKLCTQHKILLIFDEVQTGIARTGTLFACQRYNVVPDIMCLAKALGGGIPIGAVLCSDNIRVGLNQHGSTFGGNPLACASGLATLDYVVNNNLATQAEEKGAYIRKKIEDANIPIIRQVRGLGLMLGIELKTRVKKYVDELLEQGIIVLVSGSTIIRLLPPLTIPYEDIDIAMSKIIEILRGE